MQPAGMNRTNKGNAANVTEARQETPAEILALAETWLNRQREILAKAHGPSWPKHREWIEDHLREEVRQRLLARGWRPIAP